jgi:hypothetical protein
VGSLKLPASGSVYVDANVIIYTVEKIDPYKPLLDDFWLEVHQSHATVHASELSALEVLVRPVREGNSALEAAFRAVYSLRPT